MPGCGRDPQRKLGKSDVVNRRGNADDGEGVGQRRAEVAQRQHPACKVTCTLASSFMCTQHAVSRARSRAAGAGRQTAGVTLVAQVCDLGVTL